MSEVMQGFDAAMRRGRDFAAANDWQKALTEYVRAAQISPTDLSARYSLALALSKLGQFDQAMQQFQGLVKVQPQFAEAWQRIAEIQSKTGRTSEAMQTYGRVHAIHKKNGKLREVTEVLHEMVKTDPSHVAAYRELMDIAKAKGDRKGAAKLAVQLGENMLRMGKKADALSAVNEALMLDDKSTDAADLKKRLNGAVNVDELPPIAAIDVTNGRNSSDMIASMSQNEYTLNKLINDAQEALERGDTGIAMRNYEMAVEAGTNRADVFYSLGQLYADGGQTDKAVEFLTKSSADAEYAVSSFFMMGQVNGQAGRHDAAAHAYRDALDRIDLQTIGRDEVDELIVMYEALADALVAQGKNQEAADNYNKLATYINTKTFRTEKMADAMNRARELTEQVGRASENPTIGADDMEDSTLTSSIKFGGDDGISVFSEEARAAAGRGSSLAPAPVAPVLPTIEAVYPKRLLELDNDPTVAPYMQPAEFLFSQQRIVAAVDTCHEVIKYFPEYIPAHAVLAEIYVSQNRMEQARQKYQFIVDIYQLRNEPLKSIESYKRLGQISPDNQGLRTKLANLLLQYDMKEDAAELLLSTISSYVRTGQFERALEECKRLRQLSPQSANIRVQYAELLMRLERYGEALPELRRAMEIEPNHLRALTLLNITGFMMNDTNLKWGSLQTLIERGRQNENHFRLMLEDYRQATLLNSHAGLQYVMAAVDLELGQTRQAERILQGAIESAVTVPAQAEYEVVARWTLGGTYLDGDNAEKAADEFSKVAKLIEVADPAVYAPASSAYGVLPSQVMLYRKLAKAFEAQGNTEQALKSLKTVKKLLPYNQEIHQEIADLYFNQGQLTEALAELGELATHYETSNKVDQMIDILKQMANLAPNNIGVRDKLSDVYLKRGMIEEGLKELDELAELQRKNGRLKDAVRTLQKEAETFWMMNRPEQSYEVYDKIVRISPGDIDARQHLVNRYLMSGRIKEAIEEQRTIAQICLQSNNNQEAIAALHQVIGLAPDDTRAYFQLATVLSGVSEHHQAYRLYQRILRMEPDNEKAKVMMEQTYKRAVEAGQIKAGQQ